MLAAISYPILERIPLFGDVAISPHGIFTAVGFLLGGWLMIRSARISGIGAPVDDMSAAITDLLTWVGIAAVLGARGFYVLNHLGEFAAAPLSALAVWQGGLTLLGGIVGGTLAGLVVARRRGWGAGLLLDAAAPGLALGIAVGRLGDLAIGDHLGRVSQDFPLAWQCTGNFWQESSNSFGRIAPMAYPGTGPVQGCFDVPVIQTAMFDMLAASVTLVALVAVERRWRRRPVGVSTASFVVAYGLGRLALDTYRGDVRHLGLTASQWAALTAVSAAVLWFASLRRRSVRDGQSASAITIDD